jgi:hypothetical protein
MITITMPRNRSIESILRWAATVLLDVAPAGGELAIVSSPWKIYRILPAADRKRKLPQDQVVL